MANPQTVPRFNEYLKLLAYLTERLDLKNDSEIARTLEVKASTISKIRNGKKPMSPMILMRIMDRLSLTPGALKSLLGTSAYQTSVWGAKPEGLTLNFKALDADPVWTAQTETVAVLTTMIRHHGYAILKSGQRSGMSTIEARVAHRLNAEHIYFFAYSMDSAKIFPEYVDISLNTLPVAGHAVPNSLVVIDRAWDRPNQIEPFQEALKLGLPVLVVGSKGPEWDPDSGWRYYPIALSYNVWDINPYVTRAALQPHYDENPTRAKHNFEAF